MRNLILLGVVSVALAAGIAIGQRTPRFERLYAEEIDEGSPLAMKAIFVVFHDRATGQEIVRIERGSSYDSNSCYLTGRKWGEEGK